MVHWSYAPAHGANTEELAMKLQVTCNYSIEFEIDIPDGLEEGARNDAISEATDEVIGGMLYGQKGFDFDDLHWLGTTVEREIQNNLPGHQFEEILEISG